MSPAAALLARLTRPQRILAASIVLVLTGAGITGAVWASTDHPPACASPDQQNRLTMGSQEQCLEDVSNWCAANYPNEISGECMNKVYGYDPRPLGNN